MLKPLLLLCWTAIFVSAGDQKINGTSDTSVPTSLSPERLITRPQSLDKDVPIISNSEHVPSIQDEHLTNPPKLSELNADLKSKASDLDKKSYDSTSEPSVVTQAPITKPTTKLITTTTPLNTTTSTTTSTTIIPPSTTSVPTTPVPPPSTKKWIVEENNIMCIIVQMAAQFSFNYTVNNKTIHKTMDIPSSGNGTVSGICGKTEQNLTVSWNAQKDNFTLHFMKNDTTKHKTMALIHMTPQYEIGLSNSYRCFKEQKLNLYIEDECVGYLTVSNLQLQAFRGDNSTSFGLAKDCAFDTPDIVPITVGCALAGLVVIVLIAYLVGRRRSQARGYLSM
ncbi:Lysosome-associated membrane glycoprotein 1 [Harpegnathos saltator]|uniref:Lysosome-associated membrane glycoprotein 5 n=1 Tax=Harpegnathos saltator TaxID=610380 RepID=E2BYU2_HARSA|nr:Lysosome-associated membrane glycoprotein 1 [Harpegnathos saltator]